MALGNSAEELLLPLSPRARLQLFLQMQSGMQARLDLCVAIQMTCGTAVIVFAPDIVMKSYAMQVPFSGHSLVYQSNCQGTQYFLEGLLPHRH